MKSLTCLLCLIAISVPNLCLALDPRTDMYRTNHILIGVSASASPAEKAAARQKAEELLQRLHDGADFAALAKAESDCDSKTEGGDLGVVDPGQFDPVFGAAAYKLRMNELSPVVETRYGFHIIKLTEQIENEKQVMSDDEFTSLITQLRRYRYDCHPVELSGHMSSSSISAMREEVDSFSRCQDRFFDGLRDMVALLKPLANRSVTLQQKELYENAVAVILEGDAAKAGEDAEYQDREVDRVNEQTAAMNEQNRREADQHRYDSEQQRSDYNDTNSYNSYDNNRFVPTTIPQRTPYMLPGAY